MCSRDLGSPQCQRRRRVGFTCSCPRQPSAGPSQHATLQPHGFSEPWQRDPGTAGSSSSLLEEFPEHLCGRCVWRRPTPSPMSRSTNCCGWRGGSPVASSPQGIHVNSGWEPISERADGVIAGFSHRQG